MIDAGRNCRDTREEVLAAESLVAVHGCEIQVGKWRSYYDGVVTRDSTSFDIDHLAALAEAWDSSQAMHRRHPKALRERPRRPQDARGGERIVQPQRERP
jgi:hypothetical protein